MKRWRVWKALLVVLVAAPAMSGGGRAGPSDPAAVSPSTADDTPTANAGTGWSSPARIARAVAVRQSFGLPADEGWVEAVAAMPDAVANVPAFSVPMTDNEVSLLTHRSQTTQAVSTDVQRFVRDHPERWAGLYVDGGSVVAQFAGLTANLERRLRASVSPDAALVVRSVEWTTEELDALRVRIRSDAWLAARYHLLDLGVDVRRNEVQLRVAAAKDEAIADIARHYGDSGMLVVTIDGVGATEAQRGSLLGHIVDANGASLAGLDVELAPVVGDADPTQDVGIETDARGVFLVVDIAAAEYVVRVYDATAPDGTYLEGPDRLLAVETRVTVEPGPISEVTIRVHAAQP